MNSYHEILGVSESASPEEIKKAFRRKSKQYHPDVNKAENAHEQFLQLSEAYEYLVSKNDIKSQRNWEYDFFDYETYWREQERANARRRAEYNAKVKYEEFIKSDYYKATQAVESVITHLSLVLVVLIFVSPVGGYLYKGYLGLGVGLFIIFASVHFWAQELKNFKKINIGDFFGSLKYIFARKTFHLVLIGFINVFLLLRFGLSTLIPTVLFPIIYSTIILAGFLVTKLFGKLNSALWRKYTLIGIAPGIINLFFVMNFYLSYNQVEESYNYRHINENIRGLKETSSIILENDKYSDFKHIRYFIDYTKVKGTKIKYIFADGIFGLKVLKGYEFQ